VITEAAPPRVLTRVARVPSAAVIVWVIRRIVSGVSAPAATQTQKLTTSVQFSVVQRRSLLLEDNLAQDSEVKSYTGVNVGSIVEVFLSSCKRSGLVVFGLEEAGAYHGLRQEECPSNGGEDRAEGDHVGDSKRTGGG
jgi:hypothetical protein